MLHPVKNVITRVYCTVLLRAGDKFTSDHVVRQRYGVKFVRRFRFELRLILHATGELLSSVWSPSFRISTTHVSPCL